MVRSVRFPNSKLGILPKLRSPSPAFAFSIQFTDVIAEFRVTNDRQPVDELQDDVVIATFAVPAVLEQVSQLFLFLFSMLSSMLRRVGATLVRPSTAAATLAARTLRTTTPVAHGDFEWQVRRETGVR